MRSLPRLVLSPGSSTVGVEPGLGSTDVESRCPPPQTPCRERRPGKGVGRSAQPAPGHAVWITSSAATRRPANLRAGLDHPRYPRALLVLPGRKRFAGADRDPRTPHLRLVRYLPGRQHRWLPRPVRSPGSISGSRTLGAHSMGGNDRRAKPRPRSITRHGYAAAALV